MTAIARLPDESSSRWRTCSDRLEQIILESFLQPRRLHELFGRTGLSLSLGCGACSGQVLLSYTRNVIGLMATEDWRDCELNPEIRRAIA